MELSLPSTPWRSGTQDWPDGALVLALMFDLSQGDAGRLLSGYRKKKSLAFWVGPWDCLLLRLKPFQAILLLGGEKLRKNGTQAAEMRGQNWIPVIGGGSDGDPDSGARLLGFELFCHLLMRPLRTS